MNARLETLEAEALKLPASDRSHLLERLVASLDRDPEIEAAWDDEADRREQALASGEAVSVSGDEAMQHLRRHLPHHLQTQMFFECVKVAIRVQ